MINQTYYDIVTPELWKPIEGYSNYVINQSGTVKALSISRTFGRYQQIREEKVLIQVPEENGYVRVTLCADGKCKHFSVHRLVAQTFIPNPENKPTVNHKNGIKSDNRKVNLEWATLTEQIAHADEFGLRDVRGEKCHLSKLTEADVHAIRASKERASVISKKLNVHHGTIRRIRNRKLWKHI